MASGPPVWDPDGSDLTLAHTGYHIQPGSPRPRMTQHSMPGVDGVFVGFHGVGPRIWHGRGFLEVNLAAGAAAAADDLKAAVIARQGKVASEIGTYRDSTGDDYTYCVLLAYRPAGPITTHLESDGQSYTARCAVTFTIMEQDPS